MFSAIKATTRLFEGHVPYQDYLVVKHLDVYAISSSVCDTAVGGQGSSVDASRACTMALRVTEPVRLVSELFVSRRTQRGINHVVW